MGYINILLLPLLPPSLRSFKVTFHYTHGHFGVGRDIDNWHGVVEGIREWKSEIKNLYYKLISAVVVEENKGAVRKQFLSESCIEERVFELGPEGCLSWKDTAEKTTLG